MSRDAEAEGLYRQGEISLDNGHYRAAIASFQAAYDLKPLPRLLYRIAHAYRLLGQPASALRYYEDYRKAERDLTPEFKAELDQQITELRELVRRAGRLVIPPSTPEQGAGPAATLPVPGAEVGPRPGLLPAGGSGPVPPPRRPLSRKWWFWAAIGAGATGLAIATGVGVAASRPDPCKNILCR